MDERGFGGGRLGQLGEGLTHGSRADSRGIVFVGSCRVVFAVAARAPAADNAPNAARVVR